MTTTPNMSLVLPTEGGSTDIWDTILDTAFGLIDAHDHTTGKGVPVPSAGLKINADVAWSFAGTNYAITAMKALDFTPVTAASVTSYSSALFANSSDSNNLYFRNSAGTNVKITDGSTINISIAGGIGGDYASVGASLNYVDATASYELRQKPSAVGQHYARALMAGVDLYEFITSGATPIPTNRVRLSSPAALAASYTLTFPASVPASNGTFIQSSNTGTLSFSNTTTLGITAASFHNTGGYTTVVQSAEATPDTIGGATAQYSIAAWGWSPGTNTGKVIYPIPVRYQAGVTTKLDGWTIYAKKVSATGTITATLKYEANGAEVTIGSSSTNSANNPGLIGLGTASGLAHTIASGRQYWVEINGGGTTGDSFKQLDANFFDT